MDALSEALNSVRKTGAIFYHAVCTSPWGFAIPPLREYAHLLAPGTERVVSYHLMTEVDAIARPGRSMLLSKMAEALFIEALRRYREQLPAEQTGWLAAARDEIVGAAIAAMHRAPSR